MLRQVGDILKIFTKTKGLLLNFFSETDLKKNFASAGQLSKFDAFGDTTICDQTKTIQTNAEQCKTVQSNAKQCKTIQNNAKRQVQFGSFLSQNQNS